MPSALAQLKITVMTCITIWAVFALVWQCYLERKGKHVPWEIWLTTFAVTLFGLYKIVELYVFNVMHPQIQ
jgi:hypothetical protein